MSGLVKIELVGCLRYSYKSEKFERNVHYMVKADRAASLLRLTTDHGFYVFKEVGERHVPVAPRPVARARAVPVVDTTKTAEEQYDDNVAEAVATSAAEVKPVVIADHAAAPAVEPDITEEEALAATADEDELPVLEDVVVEEISVEETGTPV